MSYKSVADMAESYSLNRRLTAGAAKESIDEPQAWVSVYRWEIGRASCRERVYGTV